MVDRVGNKPSIPGGVPFGPGHPLYDPAKDDRDPKIGNPKESSGMGSLAEEILQYITQGDSPYREDYDINKDGNLSTLDAVWAGQINKGLRDPNTLEAIPQEQQEQPASTDPMETFLNPDGTLKEEYLKQVTEQMGSSPYFQSLMGEQPDLSGYAQTEDVDAAIAAALAGQEGPDLSGYAQTGDIDAAIEAALAGQAGPDLSGYAQSGDIQDMIDAAIAGQEGPDLSGYAQTGDMDAAIAAAMQGFSIDDQIRDAMELWGEDFMPTTDLSQYMTADVVQKMIDDGLANGMSAEAVLEMIEEYGGPMDPAEIEQMIADSQASLEALGGLTEAEIQKMITEGLANGMSPEDIQAMIAEATGGALTPEDIQTMITDAQATLESLGGLTQDQIKDMITQGLKDGLSPEQIEQMIADATGGALDSATVQEMIAESQATLESLGGLTEAEIQAMITDGLANGLTPEQIQQMIADATGGVIDSTTIQQMIADAIAASQTGEKGIEGMSQEDVQALLDSGYMTADQINALMADSGYLGQEGVDSSVQAALDAALGEGGSISSAIAAAMQAAGGGGETGGGETTPTEPVPAPNYTIPTSYTPYTDYSNPYGSVSPYDIMGTEQFGGTTPFSGGTTTGAATGSGISGLDLGDASTYNYDIPVTTQSGLYPSGIDQKYFEPVPEPQIPEPFPLPPHKDPLIKEGKDPRLWIGDLFG